MNSIEQLVDDYKRDVKEKRFLTRITKEYFIEKVIPLLQEDNRETVIQGWKFIAGDITLPIVIVDEYDNEIIETPALFDTKVVYDVTDKRIDMTDPIIGLQFNPEISKKRLSKNLIEIGKRYKNPAWNRVFEKLGLYEQSTISKEYNVDVDSDECQYDI